MYSDREPEQIALSEHWGEYRHDYFSLELNPKTLRVDEVCLYYDGYVICGISLTMLSKRLSVIMVIQD